MFTHTREREGQMKVLAYLKFMRALNKEQYRLNMLATEDAIFLGFAFTLYPKVNPPNYRGRGNKRMREASNDEA